MGFTKAADTEGNGDDFEDLLWTGVLLSEVYDEDEDHDTSDDIDSDDHHLTDDGGFDDGGGFE